MLQGKPFVGRYVCSLYFSNPSSYFKEFLHLSFVQQASMKVSVKVRTQTYLHVIIAYACIFLQRERKIPKKDMLSPYPTEAFLLGGPSVHRGKPKQRELIGKASGN